jgi:hypothetical protein
MYNIYTTMLKNNFPIRKAHYVGTSVVLTLDPMHVRRLLIDDATFFIQKPIDNGIILEVCKLKFHEEMQKVK